MHLVALTSSYIFHRLQTGRGSYLPEVNITHWLLWSASNTFIYSCIYFFFYLSQKRSKKTGTNVWHLLCSPVPTAQTQRHCGFASTQTLKKSSQLSTSLAYNAESVRTLRFNPKLFGGHVRQLCTAAATSPAGMCQMCSWADHQQSCSSARVNLSYHEGWLFFSTGLWYRHCRLPSEVSHWLTAFIRVQYLRRGILSEGSAFCLQKTPASYQTLSKGSYPGFSQSWESPLRGFDTLWPSDILPSVSRCLADAGGATCSVYTNSSVHVLLLVRHSPC